MGYNTVMVVLNDALFEIKKDPEFGRRISDAVDEMGNPRTQYVDVAAHSADGRSIHCNAATILSSRHADDIVVVAVGQNTGEVLGTVYRGTWDKPVEFIKQLADQHGYNLVKKPAKKRSTT